MGNSKLSLLQCIKGETPKLQTNKTNSDDVGKNTEPKNSDKKIDYESDEDDSWPSSEIESNNNDSEFQVSATNAMFRNRSFGPEQFNDTVFDDIFAHIEREATKPTSPKRKSVQIGLDSFDLS